MTAGTTNLPLTPIFSSDTAGYTATAPAGSTNINITAVAIQPDATMTINGATATNNTAIPLTLTTTATGAIATATIVVTAGNGTATKTYSIRIDVPQSNDTSLTNFAIDGISLTAGTPMSISNTLRVWGTDGSGTATTSYTLATGATIASNPATPKPSDFASSNGVTYTVTAEDGKTTKTYTYKLTIANYSDGTTANPYGIYTPAQLSDVRNALSASYKLMNDITLPAMNGYDNTADPAGMKITDYATNGWVPIGPDANTPFSGTFDGNAHILSNLSINNRNGSVGLFGAVGGVVKNIGVATSSTGIVTPLSTKANSYLGVLVGINNGNISNCYTTGVIIKNSNSDGCGGIAGGGTGNITNCYTTSSITVSGLTAQVGGLCGYPSGGNFSNCYVSGKITNTGINNVVGGIVGWNNTADSITSNCYWDTEVTTINIGVGLGNATGTTGKATADMKTQATVDTLNGTPSSGAWKYVAGSYPKLSWEQ